MEPARRPSHAPLSERPEPVPWPIQTIGAVLLILAAGGAGWGALQGPAVWAAGLTIPTHQGRGAVSPALSNPAVLPDPQSGPTSRTPLPQATRADAAPDFEGRLYRAVFEPGPDTLSSGNLADVPEPARARLSRFLARRAAFTSLYTGAAADVQGVKQDAKRRAIERAIVSLIETEGIAQRAVEFVTAAPVAGDWQESAEAPLAESGFAEAFLEKDSSTPLRPFLYLFIAQRQRAASEAADLAGSASIAQAARAKGREFLQKARGVSDPIFGWIADDLERLPHVYLKKKARAEAREP